MRHPLVIAMLFAAPPALALDSLERMNLANALGSIIAAEQFCGLAYAQPAIAAYIEAKVPADDMDFPPLLTGMISGATYQQQAMTPSAKTAHCTQIARLAKANGFTP